MFLILGSNTNSSEGYVEKRFRCSCRAPTSHHSLIKIAIAKEEERYCRHDGTCNIPSSQKWSPWSSWSECSVKCGGGYQSRSRTCQGHIDECIGPTYMSRSCNYQNCYGKWSCWGEWSACSVSCGTGIQARTRSCMGKGKEGEESCSGSNSQERTCEMFNCLACKLLLEVIFGLKWIVLKSILHNRLFQIDQTTFYSF